MPNPTTPTRDELHIWDREMVWHAFTQMAEYEPLIFERAQGCRLVDIDGRELIDGVSSLWCNLHGHRHPTIDRAIREQLDRVAHVTNLGASNPTTIELAKRLVEITPEGLNHVFFSDSGATAVEVALKMAFQYWRQRNDPRPEKTTFLALGNAYHGDTLGSVSVGGVDRFHTMFRPLLFDVIRLPAPDPNALPAGMDRTHALSFYVEQLERCLEENHDRVAAMVIEPLVQGAAGMIVHPPGYLAEVRRLTEKHDVLLIADEVAVGFGRTGKMFACEHEQVSPDLLCLAKGLTGGYLPMAATLATTEIWKAFLGEYRESRSFFHGHTYGGNPLGAAAAVGSLQVFEDEQVLEQLPAKVDRLAQHLQRLAAHPNVGDVRQRGLIAAIDLVRNSETREPLPWEEKWGLRVCQAAMRHGVWLRPLGSTLVIMPPLAISLDELDQIATAIGLSLQEVCDLAR